MFFVPRNRSGHAKRFLLGVCPDPDKKPNKRNWANPKSNLLFFLLRPGRVQRGVCV